MTNKRQQQVSKAHFVVDVRLFMISLVVAMAAAFYAGVTMDSSSDGTPLGLTDVLLQRVGLQPLPSAPPLDRSTDAIAKVLQHNPSGQHLLVDIANVEPAFLDSEEKLTNAMVQTVEESRLTILSYHCHKMSPTGVSCVGVLMDGHISFHTWPEEGVITLDLFTSAATPLLPDATHSVERFFGIPRSRDEGVRVRWSH